MRRDDAGNVEEAAHEHDEVEDEVEDKVEDKVEDEVEDEVEDKVEVKVEVKVEGLPASCGLQLAKEGVERL